MGNENQSGHRRRKRIERKIPSRVAVFILYLLSVGIYLHPLTLSPAPSQAPEENRRWKLIYDPKPQLDEIHIMSHEHYDVSPLPTTSWTEAWHNDYWGRPLAMESSHKSWRPVSIWSFRFMKGGKLGRLLIATVGRTVGELVEGILKFFGKGLTERSETRDPSLFEESEWLASELFVHRFVNVLIHAALVQIVGVVATLLFSNHNHKQSNQLLCTKYVSQLLFALHPVHVEAVANAANRGHILALLFNATIVDPGAPLAAVAFLGSLGLLTAETAIFQFPAIILTMTAIRYRELVVVTKDSRGSHQPAGDDKVEGQEGEASQTSPIVETFIDLLPRYLLLVLISFVYLFYRYYNDILSIPNGLIRPAENPFYDKVEKGEWTLMIRALNYSYILSLHIMKSLGVEIIGFSHEYGFDCIPEIQSFQDLRLLLPFSHLFLLEGILAWSWYGWKIPQTRHHMSKEQEDKVQRVLLTLVFLSWMATLFPISGVFRVGTFVADRIVLPSTIGTCVFAGRFMGIWMAGATNKTLGDSEARVNHRCRRRYRMALKIVVLSYLCVVYFAKRTHNRVSQWIDSAPLMESSLEACPRSIKSNLEMSKLHSGLIPHMLDLERSLTLIRKAQSIDATYCDVHHQLAHVYFQQQEYIEFEKETVKSLMCPFTMGQAMSNWNRYWQVLLNGGQDIQARERYEKYMKRIKARIALYEREEEKRSRSHSSPIEAKEEL